MLEIEKLKTEKSLALKSVCVFVCVCGARYTQGINHKSQRKENVRDGEVKDGEERISEKWVSGVQVCECVCVFLQRERRERGGTRPTIYDPVILAIIRGHRHTSEVT